MAVVVEAYQKSITQEVHFHDMGPLIQSSL